jgi:hypothetical protein
MKFNEARFMKRETTIYYGGCPVKFVRLQKRLGTWFVIVNDEKENPKHEDCLLLSSVTKAKKGN